MLLIDAQSTRSALPFASLVEALRKLFIEGCEVPLRHTHAIADASATGPGGKVLLMPAWQAGGFLGIKTVMIFPGNSARGLPGLHSVYQLYDATTGQPLALIDGDEITSRRTAAASALAASFLARPDAAHLLVVGTGRVAKLLPDAYRAVRNIERVTVWNRRHESAAAFAAQLSAAGWNAVATTDLEAATARADIVTCATLSEAPLIHAERLSAGTHLDLIGAFTPSMQESDVACFAKARVFVDTTEALMKAGDVLRAIEAGAFAESSLQATLEQLCRGERAGRQTADEITLFKSVGTALEDLAAAALVMRSQNPGHVHGHSTQSVQA